MNSTSNLYPFQLDMPVRWGEMDALGHVNNVLYFRYLESVRIEYFKQLLMTADLKDNGGVGPILAAVSCQFKQAISYPDDITVTASISKIGNTSLTMDYQVYSHKLKAIASEGTSVVVLINYATGEKVRISDALRAKIEVIEKRALS